MVLGDQSLCTRQTRVITSFAFLIATGSVFCFVGQIEGMWFLSFSPVLSCWFHQTISCNPFERKSVWGLERLSLCLLFTLTRALALDYLPKT